MKKMVIIGPEHLNAFKLAEEIAEKGSGALPTEPTRLMYEYVLRLRQRRDELIEANNRKLAESRELRRKLQSEIGRGWKKRWDDLKEDVN